MTEGSTIDDRVAAALTTHTASDAIDDLILDVEVAAEHSGKAADRARARALDPALTASAVVEARREMEDAAFRCDRLQQAVVQLKTRVTDVRAEEERLRRKPLYDQVAAERDELAAELKRVYPVAAAALADLIARIEANDRMIEYVNSAVLPRGEFKLKSAELVARGLSNFSDGMASVPQITVQLCLPKFEKDKHRPYEWPLSR